MRRRTKIILPLLLILLIAAGSTYNEIIWENSPMLTWEDFNHKHEDKHYTALTASGIHQSYIAKSTSYEIEIFAFFDKDESWVNTSSADANLLKHEQLHFDITELWTRRLRKAIIDAYYVDDVTLSRLYDEHLEQLVDMQRNYDKESHHSLRKKEQKIWENKVKKELNKIADYQMHTIYKSRQVVALE